MSVGNLACVLDYYNGIPQQCYDKPDPNEKPNPAENQWGIQTCNEMVMIFSQSGDVNIDMFLKKIWDADEYTA
jgi:hypothetical protein